MSDPRPLFDPENVRKDDEVIDEDACPEDLCDGSGELSTDEVDSDGNIERGVGTQKCPCSIKEPEPDY